MAENGGTSDDDAEHAAPERWGNVSSDIQRVADPVVRGVLIEQLERDREQWQQRSRNMAQLRKEASIRDARIFTDLAHLMKAIGRLESAREVDHATLQVLAAKQSTTDVAFKQLSKETGGHRVSLAELERRQAAAEKAHAQNVSKYAIDKVRFDERIAWIDKRQEKLDADVTASGQSLAVTEHIAREALDSAHEQVDEKRENFELTKQSREFKFRTWEKVLAVVGTLILLVTATLLGAKYGATNVPHLPEPAGPAHQEHHP